MEQPAPHNSRWHKMATQLKCDITLQTLLESLAQGVIVTNNCAKIILINKAIEDLFGYTEAETIGEKLNIFIPQRYHTVHHNHMKSFFASPHRRPMGEGLNLFALRKDGTEFPVEISLSYLEIEEETFAFAFVTDISDRRKAENQLKDRNKELDTFARTVAHDLNSSLTSIVGLSDLLSRKNPDFSEEQKRFFSRQIFERSMKLSNVIKEMLLLASLRKTEITTHLLDTPEIIAEALKRLDNDLSKNQITISQPQKYLSAYGYAPWIEEVWLNLISNAVRYGGTPGTIELGSTKEGNFIRYWVKDNGIGMTPSQCEKVFHIDENPNDFNIKGHGLGLSIVTRIISKLDGKVAVKSEVGRGSTFSFFLPA